ncbi:HAD-IA family hydrolase [Donghicola tyrosinivorans]|uniref:Putative hydrolase of the HAD superfamily n=1 Tax=Donghicola tyrosinivorans TaxID=1652492 RepID=A0A2T0WDK1_9RHOB|nr:HAD-IA family hydrolase [Donghicola tyrosinivorans]PRY84790.1 putative hydrolase of the HAD superfamily [Donghicola tyrosinivorans]
MTMPCQALVLDFGGVISRTLFETHDLTEAALGLAAGTLTWRGPFEPEGDPVWRAMQAGGISERDYWTHRMHETAALVGEDWTDFPQFVGRVRGADPAAVIRPEALAAIQTANAAGRKLAILSNELDLFYGADFRTKLPFLADFDVIVDATYTGILKPDPRAYQAITCALNLPPEACVFVDDQRKNIDGARYAGMQTVHFDVTDPAQSYDEALAALGISASVTAV